MVEFVVMERGMKSFNKSPMLMVRGDAMSWTERDMYTVLSCSHPGEGSPQRVGVVRGTDRQTDSERLLPTIVHLVSLVVKHSMASTEAV